MVCKVFKKGKCLEGNDTCTVEEGPGCRTRDIFFGHPRGNAVEPGSTVLRVSLTSETVLGLCAEEALAQSGCVCSLGQA